MSKTENWFSPVEEQEEFDYAVHIYITVLTTFRLLHDTPFSQNEENKNIKNAKIPNLAVQDLGQK